MTFQFNNTIPAGPNNPSADQPEMLINNQSTYSILNEDHYTFLQGAGNDGTHRQVTFPFVGSSSSFSDPASQIYTANDIFAHPQCWFQNSQGNFPLSTVKAFCAFTTLISNTSTGAMTILNGQNVTGSTQTGGAIATWTFTLNANTTSSNNAAVFLFSPNITILSTSLSGTTFTATVSAYTGARNGNLLILQI